MATTYFKKLFEVRILHEYYLAEGNQLEFFALSDQQRHDILAKKLLNEQYDIWKDLTIQPAEESKNLFPGYHIRFVPLRTGFLTGIRVEPENNRFFPFIPFDENLNFTFSIDITNPYFRNTTNYRLSSHVPGIYYFTNTDTEGNKTFPALASVVAPFQNNQIYEMGELAIVGGNLMEALERTNSTDPAKWRKVNGLGLVHEGDRMLLPKQFYYTFNKENQVTTAAFVLKTIDGTEIKRISFAQAERLDKVNLNFSTTDAEAQEIEDGFYMLEVTGDDNFQDQRRVYLHDMLYNPGNLGIVQINQNNSGFNLLEADGSLRDPAPIFEIRLKSRITYWRYLSDQGKSFTVTPKTDPYLKVVNGSLQTIAPMPLTFTPIEFRNADPAIERIFLPNPPDASIRPENDGRIYANIYLSKIKDLIAEYI